MTQKVDRAEPGQIAKGRVWPNLITTRDSENKDYAVFIVQCEVRIKDLQEARAVEDGAVGDKRTRESLEQALPIVLRWADEAGAKNQFKRIVTDAFLAQPEFER
jgi:hypothetical protein